MMASRGMGAIAPSKMPGKKEITRKDDPNKVAMYKKGGRVKKMAEGALVEDVKVKPTSATSNENYMGLGANISGNIPLSEKEKLALNADVSVGRAKGQSVRGSMDSLSAEYKRQLDKDSDIGASVSRGSSGKNRYDVSYNKRLDKDTDLGASISRGSSGKNRYDMSYNKRLDKDSDFGASFSRSPSGENRYDVTYKKRFGEGGEVWDKARPKGLGKPKKLSSSKKASAKAMAAKAGRPYPNLIDNMRAAKGK